MGQCLINSNVSKTDFLIFYLIAGRTMSIHDLSAMPRIKLETLPLSFHHRSLYSLLLGNYLFKNRSIREGRVKDQTLNHLNRCIRDGNDILRQKEEPD